MPFDPKTEIVPNIGGVISLFVLLGRAMAPRSLGGRKVVKEEVDAILAKAGLVALPIVTDAID